MFRGSFGSFFGPFFVLKLKLFGAVSFCRQAALKNGCNLNWWAQKKETFIKNPPILSSEMANKNRHKIVAVFVAFSVPSFLISLSCSPLFLLTFLLFHDILEPQTSPPNEVTGKTYLARYLWPEGRSPRAPTASSGAIWEKATS